MKALEFLFGCLHERTTFPQSPRRKAPFNQFARKSQAHETCLDCGAERPYDWEKKKPGEWKTNNLDTRPRPVQNLAEGSTHR